MNKMKKPAYLYDGNMDLKKIELYNLQDEFKDAIDKFVKVFGSLTELSPKEKSELLVAKELLEKDFCKKVE